MGELIRANKVTVNAIEDGSYKADFYRTHKHICSVNSADTEFKPTEGITKSGVRELFRAFVIEHSTEYNIEWNPSDMRASENVRKASYETDEDLISDAMGVVLPMMKGLADNCRYGVEWGGAQHEDIVPMERTPKGTDLSALGVIDGKYSKSGKWAWATIDFSVTLKFKGEEIYVPIKMELVSGQLKNPKMGITLFNDTVKAEIVNAGLATEDELDPPKESKQPVTKAEEPKVEIKEGAKAEEVPAKKTRKSRAKKTEE